MSFTTTKAEIPNAWPFADAPNTVSVSSTHIFKQGMPILQVSHDDEDGTWQFHSGQPVSVKDAMLVCLSNVTKLDPTVAELSDLPLGWQACRPSIEAPWVREPQPPVCDSDV